MQRFENVSGFRKIRITLRDFRDLLSPTRKHCANRNIVTKKTATAMLIKGTLPFAVRQSL